jgi:O-antigen/teichoic acid export membrane protein
VRDPNPAARLRQRPLAGREHAFVQLAELRGLTMLLAEPRRLRDELKRRPALTLFVGNVIAQSIGVAFSPVLSRLYSPDDFGVLGALNALVMVSLPLVSLRYEMAIPRAASERESFAMLCVCGLSIAAMSALLALACWGFGGNAYLARQPALRSLLYFVPLVALASAAFDALAMEASRRGAHGLLARSKLSQSTLGLVSGFLVNQAAGITKLFRQLVLRHPARAAPTWSELKFAAHQHRAYPFYTSWSSALDSASRWALQLAISVLWDPTIGGFIFLADRVIGRPLLMVSTSLLPVFIGDFGKAQRDAPERLPAIFFATLRRQALISFGWTLCVIVLAPLTFGPLFGPRWQGSVVYVQVMSLAIAPTAAIFPVGYTLQLLGRQRMESLMVVSKIVLVMTALAGCYWLQTSALIALGVFAALQFVHAVARIALYARAVTTLPSQPPPRAIERVEVAGGELRPSTASALER